MRLLEQHKAVATEIERYGVKPVIEPTKNGHIRFRWQTKGQKFELISAGSPSDHRAMDNNRALVRKYMKQAGVEPAPPSQKSALDDRIARLEKVCTELSRSVEAIQRNVDTVLDLVTDPNRFVENLIPMKIQKFMAEAPAPALIPEPEPAPEPQPRRKKKSGSGADCWLWRAMRYDKFLPVAEIAKAGGRSNGAASVMLTVWKAKGYVDHKDHKWRKNRKVEELGATHH